MSTSITAAAGAAPAVLDGHAVHELPLGTEVRFFDGTPQPPERHRRKRAAWKDRNGTGRLVEKAPAATMGSSTYAASFMLHIGNYGSHGTIVLVVRRAFMVTTDLRFEVIARPAPGMVQVMSRWNGRDELKHLAPDMAAAQAWMANNGGSNLLTEIVGDADGTHAMGRAA